MAKRSRRVGLYSLREQYLFDSLDEFLYSEVGPGIYTLRLETMVADLLYDERGSDTILVFFSAAVSTNSTWPHFSGLGIAKSVGASLLAISDPSIALDSEISSGWTLGDHRYPYHLAIPKIVDKIAAGRKIIFVGASAGGFAALHYGAIMPKSYSVVMNPRTHLLTPPTLLKDAYNIRYGGTSISKLAKMLPMMPEAPHNRVIYLQNISDSTYFSGHMVPYLQRFGPGKRIWTHLDHWGHGHVPMPKAKLILLLSKLVGRCEGVLEDFERFRNVETLRYNHAISSMKLSPVT